MKRTPQSEEARQRYRQLWEDGHLALRGALKGGMNAEVFGQDLVQKPDGVSERQVYNIAGEVTPFVFANLGPLSIYAKEHFRALVERLAGYIGMRLVPVQRVPREAASRSGTVLEIIRAGATRATSEAAQLEAVSDGTISEEEAPDVLQAMRDEEAAMERAHAAVFAMFPESCLPVVDAIDYDEDMGGRRMRA